jgi:cytochrome c2
MSRGPDPILESRSYSKHFFVLSTMLVIATGWAVYDEFVSRRTYVHFQREFKKLEIRRLEAELVSRTDGDPEEREFLEGRLVRVRARGTREIIQIVNDELGIGGAYTFGTVDRCPTCHLAVDRPGFEADGPEPPRAVFRTHPELERWLPAHPMADFGCTVCHAGEGRATRFVGGPANALEPGKDEPHGLRSNPDLALLRGEFAQASCHKCHADQEWLQWEVAPDEETGLPVAQRAAPAYEWGKALFADKGCGGCHLASGIAQDLRPVGPELNRIRHKVRPEWLVAWIRDPRAFRPDTRMPGFHFDETLEGDPRVHQRRALAAAAYLWQNAAAAAPGPAGAYPGGGSKDRGRELVASLGCLACHTIDGAEGRLGILQASRLEDVGAKVAAADWIWNWVQQPRWHADTTAMPAFALSPDEARDITAYLWQSASQAPAVDSSLRASLEDPTFADSGRVVIEQSGCPACHRVEGLSARRIGPDLSLFGERDLAALSFGSSAVQRSWQAWARGKLADSREFLDPLSDARMPTYGLEADEVAALTVFLRSQATARVPAHMKQALTERAKVIARGRQLLRERRCSSCHQIEGRGTKSTIWWPTSGPSRTSVTTTCPRELRRRASSGGASCSRPTSASAVTCSRGAFLRAIWGFASGPSSPSCPCACGCRGSRPGCARPSR